MLSTKYRRKKVGRLLKNLVAVLVFEVILFIITLKINNFVQELYVIVPGQVLFFMGTNWLVFLAVHKTDSEEYEEYREKKRARDNYARAVARN